MTLLIGTVSDGHVFLTADRRCVVEERGNVSRDDTFKKMFPVPGRPLALVHHGENVFLRDRTLIPLQELMESLFHDHADFFDLPSIEAITVCLADNIGPIAGTRSTIVVNLLPDSGLPASRRGT